MTSDTAYMRLAIEQAEKGMGRTSPNPCVGAVIVKDDQVLGCGYHRRAGTPHAEINAIADAVASQKAKNACVGATIYVTLEPCNHTGRTPPCTQAVLAAGIKRVVIGMADPNPVASGGADFLRSQGIEVRIHVLEQECRQINYPFLKHSVSGLPWVVMKAGMSLDGKISRIQGQGGAITGPESRRRVHELRNHLDALLIGVGTALIDDPSLTTRLEKGKTTEQGRDPLRIILDSQLRLPANAKILRQESNAPTWIFCDKQASTQRQKQLEQAGAVVHRIESGKKNGRPDLRQVLQRLGSADITSVLVEGGATVHGSFLREKLVDQVYLFTAPCFIGDQGTPLLADDRIGGYEQNGILVKKTTEAVGQDILIQGLMRW
jgi:diaminohydroxyphosphoribosylaminopyrimidine deaminase/5-amino-6-(5-phosphoribosylamino)uracil reductase